MLCPRTMSWQEYTLKIEYMVKLDSGMQYVHEHLVYENPPFGIHLLVHERGRSRRGVKNDGRFVTCPPA